LVRLRVAAAKRAKRVAAAKRATTHTFTKVPRNTYIGANRTPAGTCVDTSQTGTVVRRAIAEQPSATAERFRIYTPPPHILVPSPHHPPRLFELAALGALNRVHLTP
jgi:hypothetical protein